ncbi:Flagellar biosynthetic protein FliQ [Piscirickettsia salmonis]|uniref:Flagellar biosynthetic protein FliQ n=1 Tax=Piscirickettsia salmonis TaxID=1238 RepID=A0A1L6TBI8_PISSA|nr:flagellar biosynthesis protein FliQ [Piscirickettsia salmonis]AKP73877.1 flagellar biosynthetic protein FliQ [Piscirickettsia salmonis LF-89 = ATCC VR-1361]ALB22687.1 flagellar biosynthetic protein FliQ [Piscirickettsia salmonis]ALY02695.1 flagellar biosynthetic protein FliQ [Piscirickettsia salmonis]AMA42240.1 flagellar biosynthetic protein FliQ [Piscirickettsia salmonis]AOS34715.1 flagellar biosynthetic protein FliQ [Piscirickettsia salmonis]
MTPEVTVDLISRAVYVLIIMSSILIVPGLVVGLIIAVFQAATQINEQTLSFVPRLLATFLALVFAGPLLLKIIISFTEELIKNIPFIIN